MSAYPMLNRRTLIAAAALALPAVLRAAPNRLDGLAAACAKLEQDNGGRLGVAVLDSATGERSGYRADERFPMCSTFKFLLAAAVLQRVDSGRETLERDVQIPLRPLLSHSPLTEPHAGGTMTIAELCQALLVQSDNNAANLLLESIGGPAGVTGFCRSIDDGVTRLDRTELALNEALAGDPRDTTSPGAMAGDLNAVLLQKDVLSSASRNQLMLWMEACLTGRNRLRAKLPARWRAADRTGSNGEHTTNDIAVFWPLGKLPIIVTAYITQCPGPESKRETMLAEIGRLVIES
jgi:beta-lactamase class A